MGVTLTALVVGVRKGVGCGFSFSDRSLANLLQEQSCKWDGRKEPYMLFLMDLPFSAAAFCKR